MFIQIYISLIILASIISFILSVIMIKLSPKLGYLDIPSGRKAHKKPTPLGGGIAVVGAFSLIILAGILTAYFDKTKYLPYLGWLSEYSPGILYRANQMLGILFCGLILFTLGLFDDIKDLGPIFKLIVQLAVASLIVIGFDIRLYLFINIVWVSWLTSILWIVIIINAINFLDNIDGLSAGVSIISLLVLTIIALSNGQILVSMYLVTLIGSLIGFLILNFPPAKIFLGDAGTLPIGFFLACGSILTTYYRESNPHDKPIAVFIPIIALAIPLYDFVSVTIIRILKGKNPFIGDHRHFSHRLIRRGLTVRATVLTIYLASAGLASGAILLKFLSGLPAMLVVFQTICIVAIIAILEYPGADNL